MEELIKNLILKNKTISTMESCTGGMICNEITNIPNASKVFNFSAVTYSNEYKIKMGVKKEIIDKYSVYSKETSIEMARVISCFTNSNYGIGVTGKLKKKDENNNYGPDDLVYLTIYDKDNDKVYSYVIELMYDTRIENKKQILDFFVDKMLEIV